MSRVKISEYRAKKILLGDLYEGVSLRAGERHQLPKTGRWVVKVDQGVKKRFKLGLLAVDVAPSAIAPFIEDLEKKGFSQFLLEPYMLHEAHEERYISLERVREGVRVIYARDGGVDIESHPEAVETFIIRSRNDIRAIAETINVPENFLAKLYEAFEKYFFAFAEINPLVVRGGVAIPLDAAVLVDSAGAFFVADAWSEADIPGARLRHVAEEHVEALAKTTPASLKLSVLNPDGSLFFLLSGGGGSIVIADEAQLEGAGKEIANYGEYSGGPSREEVYLYTREILSLLLESRSQKKALIIAGGVANFTDVGKTFAGIIDALKEVSATLREQNVRVFIRRGGPNEKAGLTLMKSFLEEGKLLGSIHGSEAPITRAIEEAIQFTHQSSHV